jgi:hypothetical protein
MPENTQMLANEDLTTYRELGGKRSAIAELLAAEIDSAENGALGGPMR